MRRALAISAVATGIAAACAVYSDDLLVPSGQVPDASTSDASSEAGCVHARPPPRPSADGVGDADVDAEHVFALSQWDLGFGDAGIPFAYDLDDRCTCPEKESCVPVTGAPLHCDDDAGRDNSGLALALTLSKLTNAFDDKTANKRLAQGTNGLLVRIRGWNGADDDRDVEVSLFVSNGTTQSDAGNIPPSHDGGDVWTVDPPSLVGGVGPPYVAKFIDTNAYVSGGLVVATLDFPVALGRSIRGTVMILGGAIMSARIDRLPGGGLALSEGRATGRWPTRGFLTGLQTVSDPITPGAYLCGDSGVYQSLKEQICAAADISASPIRDNSNSPCDAISIAVGWRAEQALLSGVVAIEAGIQGCGPTYTDDCR